MDGSSVADGPSGQYFGKVLFELFYYGLIGPQTTSYNLYVHFAPPADIPSLLACPTGAPIAMGTCCFAPPSALDGGVTGDVSAGDLTMKDNGSVISTLMYGPNGYDANNATLAMGWTPGQDLEVAAAGSTVAAFSGRAGAPPQLSLKVTSMNGSNLDVSVGKDWAVGWTPATLPGDQIVAALVASEGEVKCVADDQAGTLTMPVAMLGKFNAQEKGYLTIVRVALSDVTTSNATVEIGATTGQGVNVQFTP